MRTGAIGPFKEDAIYLRRNRGGEYENAAILVAVAVNEDGYREMLGAAEGMKEDRASWVSFFQWLRGRGPDGVKLAAKMLKAIRTNNLIERLNREIRRRTRVVGCFPDGNSALMLVRHVAGTQWGKKIYKHKASRGFL